MRKEPVVNIRAGTRFNIVDNDGRLWECTISDANPESVAGASFPIVSFTGIGRLVAYEEKKNLVANEEPPEVSSRRGSQARDRFERCPDCRGRGSQTISPRPNMLVCSSGAISRRCPRCEGGGKIPYRTPLERDVEEVAQVPWSNGAPL